MRDNELLIYGLLFLVIIGFNVFKQFLAVRASGSRADGLRNVQLPMLVIHGDRDTLLDQSGGRRTAARRSGP